LKNKSWVFTIKLLFYTTISLLLALLVAGVLAYAYYVLSGDIKVRDHMLWLEDTLRDLLREYYVYIYIVIVLVLAAALLLLFTRRIRTRISAIQHAVTQISTEDYRVLLPNDINDSLGVIEKGLNALADQIKYSLDERIEIEQAKDDFIVNIAHDLRTPLTSVIGYLALISEKQIDKEISTKYAAIAYDKSIQLQNIVEVLFDVAAYAMESIQIDKQEVDLIKFFAQKQDEMYPQLQDAGMEMRINIPKGMPPVHVDGDLMARVVDNLVINAIRYAKEGKYIDISAQEQSENIVISLVTHSNPVPSAELERIFDKFYRLEKSRSVRSGGVGLGLSISRRLVELHGGTLSAGQTADGTAFDIRLPK